MKKKNVQYTSLVAHEMARSNKIQNQICIANPWSKTNMPSVTVRPVFNPNNTSETSAYKMRPTNWRTSQPQIKYKTCRWMSESKL